MYIDTITLFNRKKGRHGDTWHPTVLHGVNINLDKGAIIKTYGPESDDQVILNIRYSGDHIITSNNPMNDYEPLFYTWLPPKEWQKLDDMSGSVTFASGTAFDFFWIGEWEGGSVIYDDNYGDMSFYDYMLQNYDFVFAITSVGYYSIIPHFEIAGR